MQLGINMNRKPSPGLLVPIKPGITIENNSGTRRGARINPVQLKRIAAAPVWLGLKPTRISSPEFRFRLAGIAVCQQQSARKAVGTPAACVDQRVRRMA